MTIQEMKRKKTELGLTNEMLAESSGIPLGTVQKIMSGITKAPRKDTIDAIEQALLAEESKKNSGWRKSPSGIPAGTILRESKGAYAPYTSRSEKIYTAEDYYALPEERRVELIDGLFYEMAAPSVLHQKILGELYLLFRECMDHHKGSCEVFLSPCDVRLDLDDRTIVQPDLFVICGPYDLYARAFDGAPDLTVEILSPSTRSKDMLLKLYKYHKAGVKEYWIIDPDYETVLVYHLDDVSLYPDRYDFHSVIPVGISKGSCSIDFARVCRAIQSHGA